MSWKHFWSGLALGAASVLACSAPALAKDRDDDSSKATSTSSDEKNSKNQDTQRTASNQSSRDQSNRDDQDDNAKHHAALGVSLQDDDGRLRVLAVLPGSPAALAGIRNGDEITSVDGERIRTAQQLTDEIGEKQPGEQVSLVIRRNGEKQTLRAKLVSLDMLRSRGNSADRANNYDRNQSDYNASENRNRGNGAMNRGRAASFDEDQVAGQQNERIARQLRALQQQVMRLEQEIDDLRANRSAGRQTTGYRGNMRNGGTAQAAGVQGNGDNSWYYQSQPEDQSQGIHDFGGRARDGQ